MKIDAFGNIKDTNPVKKRSGVSSSGIFSSILDAMETEETNQTNRPTGVVATTDIASMLALQEISEEEIRRKKAIKHGEEMLNSLENLRRRLLMGTLPMEVLQDISKQLSIQKQEVADPKLIEIMNEIELRTAVELAKLEMAIASRSVIE